MRDLPVKHSVFLFCLSPCPQVLLQAEPEASEDLVITQAGHRVSPSRFFTAGEDLTLVPALRPEYHFRPVAEQKTLSSFSS